MSDFRKIWHNYGNALLHESQPVWIRRYSAIDGVRFKRFQAFRAVEPCPNGRYPWTVDNRRIGPKDGFRTLKDAVQAARAEATNGH